MFEEPTFKAYSTLFNGITDAIATLQDAQKKAEELYISKPNTNNDPYAHAFKNVMLQTYNQLPPELQLAINRIVQNIEIFEQLCYEPIAEEELERMRYTAVKNADYLQQTLIEFKRAYDNVRAEIEETQEGSEIS